MDLIMGMRTVFDPYGGPTPMIDKLIGSAFPLVKAVAENLDQINYVTANMASIVQAAVSLTSLPPVPDYVAAVAANATLAQTAATQALSAEASVQATGNALSAAVSMISSLSQPANTDPLTFLSESQDLGNLIITAPFSLEAIPLVRLDLALSGAETVNLGSVP